MDEAPQGLIHGLNARPILLGNFIMFQFLLGISVMRKDLKVTSAYPRLTGSRRPISTFNISSSVSVSLALFVASKLELGRSLTWLDIN